MCVPTLTYGGNQRLCRKLCGLSFLGLTNPLPQNQTLEKSERNINADVTDGDFDFHWCYMPKKLFQKNKTKNKIKHTQKNQPTNQTKKHKPETTTKKPKQTKRKHQVDLIHNNSVL